MYGETLEWLGVSDAALEPEAPQLYVAACRMTKRNDEWTMETWTQTLALGKPLPTMPLWLADNLAVPLELEESYEQSCGVLSIP